MNPLIKPNFPLRFLKFGVDEHGVLVPILKRSKERVAPAISDHKNWELPVSENSVRR